MTDDELRDGKDEPGVLDGNNGFEARSTRGGRSGTAKTKGRVALIVKAYQFNGILTLTINTGVAGSGAIKCLLVGGLRR